MQDDVTTLIYTALEADLGTPLITTTHCIRPNRVRRIHQLFTSAT
jgi:hypothetical protein